MPTDDLPRTRNAGLLALVIRSLKHLVRFLLAVDKIRDILTHVIWTMSKRKCKTRGGERVYLICHKTTPELFSRQEHKRPRR
jgi:hypothetical protein